MSGKRIRFLPPRGASERERDFAINELIKAANEPGVTASGVPIAAIDGMSAENVQGALEELAGRRIDLDLWQFQPLGSPIPIFTHIFASVAEALPPTDRAYRYVLLTAGESYNSGVLTSESVTGSAPLVQATAVVSLAGSPFNGKTLRLINTERRFLRAGSAGTVENDQMQQITGGFVIGRGGSLSGESGAFADTTNRSGTTPSSGSNNGITVDFNSANSPDARTGTETRPKNIGATYIMRIR